MSSSRHSLLRHLRFRLLALIFGRPPFPFRPCPLLVPSSRSPRSFSRFCDTCRQTSSLTCGSEKTGPSNTSYAYYKSVTYSTLALARSPRGERSFCVGLRFFFLLSSPCLAAVSHDYFQRFFIVLEEEEDEEEEDDFPAPCPTLLADDRAKMRRILDIARCFSLKPDNPK